MAVPDKDDVVIRQKRGPSIVYLLGTPSAPNQFLVHTRDEAVFKALTYAEHQHVAAWFGGQGDDDFVLIEDCRVVEST